jgi:hypothetical protein
MSKKYCIYHAIYIWRSFFVFILSAGRLTILKIKIRKKIMSWKKFSIKEMQ